MFRVTNERGFFKFCTRVSSQRIGCCFNETTLDVCSHVGRFRTGSKSKYLCEIKKPDKTFITVRRNVRSSNDRKSGTYSCPRARQRHQETYKWTKIRYRLAVISLQTRITPSRPASSEFLKKQKKYFNKETQRHEDQISKRELEECFN